MEAITLADLNSHPFLGNSGQTLSFLARLDAEDGAAEFDLPVTSFEVSSDPFSRWLLIRYGVEGGAVQEVEGQILSDDLVMTTGMISFRPRLVRSSNAIGGVLSPDAQAEIWEKIRPVFEAYVADLLARMGSVA